MVDVLLPTNAGHEPTLSRCTQPEPEQRMLLQRLRLTLPAQPPPKTSATQVRAVTPGIAL